MFCIFRYLPSLLRAVNLKMLNRGENQVHKGNSFLKNITFIQGDQDLTDVPRCVPSHAVIM